MEQSLAASYDKGRDIKKRLESLPFKPQEEMFTSLCKAAFSNAVTGGKFHPYKDYQTYYPDWTITGDASVEASDYWKYVMARFNERIATDRGGSTLPADLPEDWKALTPDDAMKSLKESFNMK
ncbi:unnamed protein product [Coregonus sp. 'balchen']|nr:unnamed protein product [Coregonus sp. 'balchen']